MTEPGRPAVAPPPRSLLLWGYLWLSRRAGRLADRRLAARAARGKEDRLRLDERRGIASVARPTGRLVWFHAASVGEALAVLELIRRLPDRVPDCRCLITTGTVTSASLLARRLPVGAIHQFAPLDVLPWVERFLDHWRPDLLVLVESELWPAMIVAAHARGVPIFLVNGRMSARSARGWRRLGGMARALFGRIERVMVQTPDIARMLRRLGAAADALEVTGSLKEGAAPLPHDEAARRRISAALGGRPVWLAASTHPGEEMVVAEAHRHARRNQPRLMLIIAPRHPERGDGIAETLRAAGWRLTQRSRGELIQPDTDIYLADTLGEMGLWYRIAPVSFVGGSLVPVGGHNPFEPALLGSAILHGPHVENFADSYGRFHAAGAAILVRDGKRLGPILAEVLEPARAAGLAAAAWATCSEGAGVTDRVLAELARRIGAG